METFAKSEKEVSDGMDITLCALDRRTNALQWAGANNPLWIANSGAAEMAELKPDKQPVGYFENRKPFTTQTLSLEKGATIYLFTDGYADQFGGAAGKKFKYKQLKDLLLAHRELPIPEQRKLLSETFAQWKGALEQVDDVCVIGIHVG
jgi:serine phosphatase RsbU (regulator of sigma subunit)